MVDSSNKPSGTTVRVKLENEVSPEGGAPKVIDLANGQKDAMYATIEATASGSAVIRGDANDTLVVAALDLERVQRLSNGDTRITSRTALGDVDVTVQGIRNVTVTEGTDTGIKDLRLSASDNSFRMPPPTNAKQNADGSVTVSDPDHIALTVRASDLTINVSGNMSDDKGKPGTLHLSDKNDKADITLDDSAFGKAEIDGGRGNDSITLRAKDGKLVTLDDGTKAFIRSVNGNNFVLGIKDVENITIVYEDGPANTPAGAPNGPAQGKNR
ncbi:MAG: hypothetical protein K2X09_00075 [Rickettsiales bacterium]|nr:hypothetical protein [Rickettsiales bacterium]